MSFVKIKRYLAVIMVLAMCFSMVPASAFAEDTDTDIVSTDETVTTEAAEEPTEDTLTEDSLTNDDSVQEEKQEENLTALSEEAEEDNAEETPISSYQLFVCVSENETGIAGCTVVLCTEDENGEFTVESVTLKDLGSGLYGLPEGMSLSENAEYRAVVKAVPEEAGEKDLTNGFADFTVGSEEEIRVSIALEGDSEQDEEAVKMDAPMFLAEGTDDTGTSEKKEVSFTANWLMLGNAGASGDYEYLDDAQTSVSIHPTSVSARDSAAGMSFSFSINQPDTAVMAPGDIKVVIPAYLFTDWDGNPIRTFYENSFNNIPNNTSTPGLIYYWYYSDDGDSIIIENYESVTGSTGMAAIAQYSLSSGSTYSGNTTSALNISGGGPRQADGTYVAENVDGQKIKDNWSRYVSAGLLLKDEELNSQLEENGGISRRLYAEMHTKVSAQVWMTNYQDHNDGVYLSWLNEWGEAPEGKDGLTKDDYFYVLWAISEDRIDDTSTQPWDFTVLDADDGGELLCVYGSISGQYHRYAMGQEVPTNTTTYYSSGLSEGIHFADRSPADSTRDVATKNGYVYADTRYYTASQYRYTEYVALKRYPKSMLMDIYNETTQFATLTGKLGYQRTWESDYIDRGVKEARVKFALVSYSGDGDSIYHDSRIKTVPGARTALLNDVPVKIYNSGIGCTWQTNVTTSQKNGSVYDEEKGRLVSDPTKVVISVNDYVVDATTAKDSATGSRLDESDYELTGFTIYRFSQYSGTQGSYTDQDGNTKLVTTAGQKNLNYEDYDPVEVWVRARGSENFTQYATVYARDPVTSQVGVKIKDMSGNVLADTYNENTVVPLPADTVEIQFVQYNTHAQTQISVRQIMNIFPTDHVKELLKEERAATQEHQIQSRATYTATVKEEGGTDYSVRKGSITVFDANSVIRFGDLQQETKLSKYSDPEAETKQYPEEGYETVEAYIDLRQYVDMPQELYKDKEFDKKFFPTQGVFYDLLPFGTTVDSSSVRIRAGSHRYRNTDDYTQSWVEDFLTNKGTPVTDFEVIQHPNWEGTGQTMLEIRYTAPESSVKADCFYHVIVGYTLKTTYVNLIDTAGMEYSTLNSVAWADTRDPHAYVTPASGRDSIVMGDAYKTIDETHGTDNTVYAQATMNFAAPGVLVYMFAKQVSTPLNTTYLDRNDAMVGDTYTYSIIHIQDSNTYAGNLVLFDLLERGTDSEWIGKLQSVNTTSIASKIDANGHGNCAPVVYYSTAQDISDQDYDLDNGKWSADAPADLSTVTAIAIDCRKTNKTDENGEPYDFVLPTSGQLVAYITMEAPAGTMEQREALEGKTACNLAAITGIASRDNELKTLTTPIKQEQKAWVTLHNYNVSISKTSDPESFDKTNPVTLDGLTLSYSVTLKNEDTEYDAVNIMAEDPLDEAIVEVTGITYQIGENEGDATSATQYSANVSDDNTVNMRVSRLAKGESVTFTFEVKLSDDVKYTKAKDYIIENTAKLKSVADLEYEKTTATTYHQLPVCGFTAEKVWEDDSNRDNIRPATIQLQLHRDGTAFGDPVTVKSGDGWKYEFTKLPVFSSTGYSVYTVEEVSVPDGYEVSYTGSYTEDPAQKDPAADADLPAVKVTNTHEPEVISATVTKVWDDEQYPVKRPASIKVQLYADDQAYSETPVELNAENEWTYTWEKLAKYKTGKQGVLVKYEVYELDASGAKLDEACNYDDHYKVSYDTENGKVTNSLRLGDVEVTKLIHGNDCDTEKTFTFTMTLKDGDAAAQITGTFGDLTFTEGVSEEFTLGDKQSKKATGLPLGLSYEITEKEANKEGYATTTNGAETGTVKETLSSAVFTNTRDTYGSFLVKKTVTGNDPDLITEFSFTATLSDLAINGTYGDLTFENGIAKFTLKNDETKVAENLPNGVSFTVEEQDYSGQGYVTTGSIEILPVEKPLAEEDETETETETIGRKAEGQIDDEIITSIVIENHRDTEGDLVVTKHVKGNAGDKTKQFRFTVTLNDTEINETFGDMEFVDGVATFTLKDGESKTATGLPNGIGYEVTEADYSGDGYRTTKTGDTGVIVGEKTVKAEFTNTKSKNPLTGDDNHMEVWFALQTAILTTMSGIVLTLKRKKNT